MTALVLGAVVIATGASILTDAFDGLQLWGELFEVPLMSAMFLAMVWHARRRAQALRRSRRSPRSVRRCSSATSGFLHNVSHELRTPVTIARGHLELLERRLGGETPELARRVRRTRAHGTIVERILLLARAEQPESIERRPIPLVPFLEDVFMRWAEVAPRAWRLGAIVDVTLDADETWLRAALDAILENAVHHTEPYAAIELSARGDVDEVVIVTSPTADRGSPASSLDQIFERFARTDDSRRAGKAAPGSASRSWRRSPEPTAARATADNVAGAGAVVRTAAASPPGGAGRRGAGSRAATAGQPGPRLESA